MELKKQSESVSRIYQKDGSAKERIDTVQYSVTDEDGNTVGGASVYSGGASVSITLSGFGSIDEGVERVEALFARLKG